MKYLKYLNVLSVHGTDEDIKVFEHTYNDQLMTLNAEYRTIGHYEYRTRTLKESGLPKWYTKAEQEFPSLTFSFRMSYRGK